jgi:cytochrome c-type biogenesis protein CcsB
MELFLTGITALYIISSACYLLHLFLQKKGFIQGGFYAMLLGFCLHTGVLGFDWIKNGHVPVTNLHETLSALAWALSGIFLGFQHRYQMSILGTFAAPLCAVGMLVASYTPAATVQDLNIYKSVWLAFHILAVFAGEAFFALACIVGILYLIQEDAIKKKRRGFFFNRLPSLDKLDASGYASIVAGFTLLSIGLVTGFVYAKVVWGRFLSWDPKEIWSAITWLTYAALIHERLTVGWRGRKSAVMAIIGFAVVLFTFFGVNFLLKGHHGGFTNL